MMNIVRRKGRRRGPLTRLQEEMGDVFGRFFGDWPLAEPGGTLWPALDVAERDDAIVVKAELPGLKADDIDISVRDNMLIISGEKKESHEDKTEDYYHVERRYGAFRREVALAAGVDPDKIQASYRDGVLTITMPKSDQAKPKRIKIHSE